MFGAWSFVFLFFNVSFYGFFRNMTDTFNIIRARPERRQTTNKRFEFFAKLKRSVAFQLLRNIMRREGRVGFHKQMNVVGHNFHTLNTNAQTSGFFKQKLFQSGFNSAREYFAPIFIPFGVIKRSFLRLSDSPFLRGRAVEY